MKKTRTNWRALAALLALLPLTAAAEKKEGKARLELPKGGRYAEVLFTSTWFSNPAVLGPIGGPTRGYDLALQAWPKGPTLLLAGKLGKDELDRDPLFLALKTPSLKLAAAADGHAVAWTTDSKQWRALYLDGPHVFFCPHTPVGPKALPPTAEVVREVLTKRTHGSLPDMSPNRGELRADRGQELRGALAFAVRPGGDATLNGLAQAFMADPRNQASLHDADVTDLSELMGDELPPPAPARVEPVSTCPMVQLNTRPLPAVLTTDAVLERLVFPDRVDDATCATWRELRTRIELRRTTGAASTSPPTGCSCGQMLLSAWATPFPPSLTFSEGAAVVDSYEESVSRCGHAGEPDPACEGALLKAKQREWATVVEEARRASCTGFRENVGMAARCSSSASACFQLWQALEMLVLNSQRLYCPPTPAEWPTR